MRILRLSQENSFSNGVTHYAGADIIKSVRIRFGKYAATVQGVKLIIAVCVGQPRWETLGMRFNL